MSIKYHVETRGARPRFAPVARLTALEIEGCLGCRQCVKRDSCVYRVYEEREYDPGQLVDTGDGMCVACYSGDQSVCIDPSVCDEVNRECTIQCTDANTTWACETRQWHCDPDRDNLCVECLEDEHCAPFQHCDAATGHCNQHDQQPENGPDRHEVCSGPP